MRNIRKPVVRILLNTLDYTKVGLYNDYNSSRMVMTFRQLGIQIVGQTANGTKASPADPVIGGGGLMSGLKVAKSTSDSGVKQILALSIAPPAPCESCYWDYGVTLREKVRFPGIHSNRTNVVEKSYGGTRQYITSTSGVVDDTYRLIAETDIINQITNDTGEHIAETRYPMKMTGSAVAARRLYKCTITNAANEIDFFDSAGVAIGSSIVTGATGKLAAEAINADATVGAQFMAFPANQTTSFYVMSKADGLIYTIADGAGTGTLTVAGRYIAFLSKDEDIQFDLLYEAALGGTTSKFSLYTLDGNTGAGTTTIYVDGVSSTAAADAADLEDYATELNSHCTGASITNVWACSDATAGVVYVWGSSTAKVVNFVFSSTSTTTVTDKYSGYPKYPQLTSEDVFRIFWNNKDSGFLGPMQYAEQPLENTNYNVYYIRNENLKITSLHGAGYNQTGEVEYEIYVPTSICTTNYWDADAGATGYAFMTAPTSADTSFEGLLGILTGLAVTSW